MTENEQRFKAKAKFVLKFEVVGLAYKKKFLIIERHDKKNINKKMIFIIH